MDKRQAELSGVGIIASYFSIQLFAAILWMIIAEFNGINLDSNQINSVAAETYFLQASASVEIGYLLIIGYIYRRLITGRYTEIVTTFPVFIKKLTIYLVCYVGLIAGANIINNLLFSNYATELGANEELIQSILGNSPGLLIFLSITVTGPLVEEYVFRYGVIGKLLANINRYVAATIATIIFAFIHIGFGQIFSLEIGMTIHLFLLYMPISIILNFVYAKETNLVYPIIIHIINNSIAVISAITAYNIFL